MTVITRFAPSPTGMLHIGGARTALFNWLFARQVQGKFLLRIEDTDKLRSEKFFEQGIIQTLDWLGLNWNDDIVYQSKRIKRHREIAFELLAKGQAYYCGCSKEELAASRNELMKNKQPLGYNGKCANFNLKDPNLPLRLKINKKGVDEIEDLLQARVKVENKEIEDFVLLRADGTPTYMLSVVVDDHDMNISHIIRGDDHLNNAFKQKKIYEALGWTVPKFCHIPLIHSLDGKKLSKRHGAVFVGEFREQGVLPAALINTLLRLGWAHGNEEIIAIKDAIAWFGIAGMGKGAAKFDPKKLEHLNHHYIKNTSNEDLIKLLIKEFPDCKELTSPLTVARLTLGLTGIKTRAKNLNEILDYAKIYFSEFKSKPLEVDTSPIELVRETLSSDDRLWEEKDLAAAIEKKLRNLAETQNIKLGHMMKSLRLALTNSNVSPSLFEVMAVLGAQETLKRLATSYKSRI